ncbi:MAG: hypothetical protein R3E95_09245 [Thiolinea sp.]
MKNLFRYLVIHPLLVLLLVVLLVIGAVLVLSFTQLGTGILVNAAERFVPALELDGVRGRYWDRLRPTIWSGSVTESRWTPSRPCSSRMFSSNTRRKSISVSCVPSGW